MLEKLQNALEKMSEGVFGDAVSRVGFTSVGVGTGVGAGSGIHFTDLFQYMPHTWPEWAAFCSIIGVLPMFIRGIFKSIVDAVSWCRGVR